MFVTSQRELEVYLAYHLINNPSSFWHSDKIVVDPLTLMMPAFHASFSKGKFGLGLLSRRQQETWKFDKFCTQACNSIYWL